MRLLCALYSWPAFDDATTSTLLLKSLLVISSEKEDSTIQVAATNAVSKLATNEAVIVDLTTAVHLINVLTALSRFTGADVAATAQVRQLCKMFISRKWMTLYGAVERGSQCNVLLDVVLRGLFGADSKLSFFKQYLTIILDEVKQLNGRNDVLKTFPNFHK